MLRNPEIPKLPPLSYKDRKKRFGGSEISSFLNYERDKSLNVHVIEKPVAQLRTELARLVGETQKKKRKKKIEKSFFILMGNAKNPLF